MRNFYEKFKNAALKNSEHIKKLFSYFKDEKLSSERLNAFMKKKQNLAGVLLILFFLFLIVMLHHLASDKKDQKEKSMSSMMNKTLGKQATIPDGVLSSDFSMKNNLSALEEQQSQIDQLNKSIKKITDDLKDKSNNKNTDQKNIVDKNNIPTNAFPKSSALTVVPVSDVTAQTQVNNTNYPAVTPYNTSFNTISFSYAKKADSQNNQFLNNQAIFRRNNQTSSRNTYVAKTPKTWVPAGTFDRVVLLVGADANASVNGQSDTVPILMRFLDDGTLPNGYHSHLKGCFALASIYGDISSERGEARLNKISCTQKDGSILEMPVEGFISFAGKEGIRGIPVMRNGKILTMAGISGMLSGFGSALAQGSQTQSISPLGATTTVSPSQVWQSGAYTGASTAMSQLASYYIKRADQYHPVIDIGSGTVATVVFQTGFSLVPKSSHKNNTQSQGSTQNFSSNSQSLGDDASEIKALLKENEILSQQKMQNSQDSQNASNMQNQMTSGASTTSPFSNVS